MSPETRLYYLRKKRARKRADAIIGVDLSPLIDCVFLLLIFFLVTTMMKKLEKQIPVTLPDSTAQLAAKAESPVTIFGIDDEGNIFSGEPGRNASDPQYKKIANFAENLKALAEAQGTDIPIRIDADSQVGFQKVIDTLDILSIQGFENVGVRMMHEESLYYEFPNARR